MAMINHPNHNKQLSCLKIMALSKGSEFMLASVNELAIGTAPGAFEVFNVEKTPIFVFNPKRSTWNPLMRLATMTIEHSNKRRFVSYRHVLPEGYVFERPNISALVR